ncbi:Region of a membrane-bound protein predicted to be embedded in the membrane [Methanobacterium congolense]|uniref:Region of a membrane-bound protein predicted to be embedded in the membrane n=1 Tax=Methanobacterium congolense TaxID=118062 RepID=A0A1D3KZQ3_9EURY|nr:Region of a membrane-bound protein predicted to be embedded in the membrane [Methanobacterium congolense]
MAAVSFVCVAVLVIEALLSLMGYSSSEGTAHHPLIRLLGWIIGAIVAVGLYNLIKGPKPEGEEVKNKTPVTSDKISMKLEEKRDIGKK